MDELASVKWMRPCEYPLDSGRHLDRGSLDLFSDFFGSAERLRAHRPPVLWQIVLDHREGSISPCLRPCRCAE